jgi:hypothetical protein
VSEISPADLQDEIGAAVAFEVLEQPDRIREEDIQKRVAVHLYLMLAELPAAGTA